MMESRNCNVTVFPKGNATVHVHPYDDGFLGTVRLGEVTIQSPNMQYLRQLAAALNEAAAEMASRQGDRVRQVAS